MLQKRENPTKSNEWMSADKSGELSMHGLAKFHKWVGAFHGLLDDFGSPQIHSDRP